LLHCILQVLIVDPCGQGNETWGSVKRQVISCLAERLLVPQEILYSINHLLQTDTEEKTRDNPQYESHSHRSNPGVLSDSQKCQLLQIILIIPFGFAFLSSLKFRNYLLISLRHVINYGF
jgi:hypothetical protein